MNILFLTNAYPDFPSSYRGNFIKEMANRLQKSGFRITVVTPKIYKGSPLIENRDGIKVYRFPFFARNKLLIEHQRIPFLRMILYCLTGFLIVTYVAIKHRISLVHVHWAVPTGLIGILAGALLKKPVVVTVHGSDLRMALEKPGLVRRIFIYVCSRACHLNCVSHEQKKQMESLGISSEKISIIPMGVGEAFLEIGRTRQDTKSQKSCTILSNRNLLPIYNVSQLIRAIPIVLREEPGTRFLIAGEGTEKIDLEKETERLNVKSSVQFLGRVPHGEMPYILARSDIYVSTSFYDGTSVSLLEALASGAFPIVTDIPTNREWIVEGKNGYTFPIGDEKALAWKILDAIRNKEMLVRVRKSNQTIIEEKVLWPICIQRIKEIYEDQLGKSRACLRRVSGGQA